MGLAAEGNWFECLISLASIRKTIHAGFRNEDAEQESVPYSEHQEEAPDSNPDGRAQQAGQMDSR